MLDLTKLEIAFFETLDLMCRLKLGINDDARATDKGAQFIEDCFDLLCNIMSSDDMCFHKLCTFYRSVNASLPEGVAVSSDEALAAKHACEKVFASLR